MLGRETATLVDGPLEAGYHHLSWEADEAATGLYIVRMQAGSFGDVQKVLLMR